jgi:tRNA(Ile2)-agmatinylcytidine synthase
MWIGIDDTDSLKGGCTTHIAALISKRFKVVGYPRLVRLNPNIPFKTRGNGAVAINVLDNDRSVKKFVLDLVKNYAHLNDPKTNPGVLFIEELSTQERKLLNEFYLTAVSRFVPIQMARSTAEQTSAEVHMFKNGRGLIGALASVGCILSDRTYEFIAYRNECATGPRKIDVSSVFEMNAKTYPQTYDNVDLETNQLLIMPRGYDPLFCGIRGETPDVVERAWRMLRPLEEISLTQIFETNQGTDSHLRRTIIAGIRPYDCVLFEGIVSTVPKTIPGGHVLFQVSDSSGAIWCAAYKPTGGFRNVVRGLTVDDAVMCCGGVGRYTNTVNLEKLFVSRLARRQSAVVPNCCGRKMTSAGTGKGYKCRRCRRKARPEELHVFEQGRALALGWHEVPPRARRHLSKPLIRN